MKSDRENDLFQIGELGEKAGVSKRTIRYYEEIGILQPTDITSGGFRLYSDNDLYRLEIINYFKELGFSLEEIKELLKDEPVKNKKEQIKHSKEVLETQLQAVQEQIDRLKKIKEKNEKALAMIEKCMNCSLEKCPYECPNRRVHL